MPAFQREYVWNSKQIEKLWDSILLDYPISNFLFWHIDDSNVRKGAFVMSGAFLGLLVLLFITGLALIEGSFIILLNSYI